MKGKLVRLSVVSIMFMLCAANVGAQPALSLRAIDGRTVNLADERGSVVVLAFGATWTPLASRELPALQELADKYAGSGATFYWVSINSAKQGARNYASDADLQAFAVRHGLKVGVLRDPDQAAYRALGLTGLPGMVVIDKSGQIAHRHIGFDPRRAESFGDVDGVLNRLLM